MDFIYYIILYYNRRDFYLTVSLIIKRWWKAGAGMRKREVVSAPAYDERLISNYVFVYFCV